MVYRDEGYGSVEPFAVRAERTLAKYIAHATSHVSGITVRPATMSKADRWLKSWSSAAPANGSAYKDSPGLESSPCSACTVPVDGPGLSSVAAQCRGNSLARVAAKAADLKIGVTGIKGLARGG